MRAAHFRYFHEWWVVWCVCAASVLDATNKPRTQYCSMHKLHNLDVGVQLNGDAMKVIAKVVCVLDVKILIFLG